MSLGPNIVTDGLIFAIDPINTKSFTQGSTAVDNMITRNEIQGTLINGVSFDGDAWDFDGVDDRMSIPLLSTVRVLSSTTHDIWAYNDPNETGGRQFWTYSDNAFYPVIRCQFLGSGSAGQIQIASSLTQTLGWGITTSNQYFGWVNVVVTKDSGGNSGNNYNCKMYVNGVLVQQSLTLDNTTYDYWMNTFSESQLANDLNLAAMYRAPSQENYYNIDIGPFKVYDRILTDEEIQQNYEALKWRFE